MQIVPLHPVKTGLPVHVNAYFELSSNRRDIWFGGDMAGGGAARSEWNAALLQDAVVGGCTSRIQLHHIACERMVSGLYKSNPVYPQQLARAWFQPLKPIN
jgi:hypothetical protein